MREKRGQIAYAIAGCPLGRLLVAATQRGVCAVKLGDSGKVLEKDLRSEFPEAELTRDDAGAKAPLAALLRHLEGKEPHLDLPLDLRATAFQRRVWAELQAIPAGETRTYKEIAAALGLKNSARAVGSACAANPAALIVPCHRVVRADGGLAGYRWGVERKKKLLEKERKKKAGKK